MDGEAMADRPGYKQCDLPGWESAWVQFRTTGYPFRLRREWAEASGEQTLEIVLRYVDAWAVPTVAGDVAPLPALPRAVTVLDDVEDILVLWLVRMFQRVWLSELTVVPKNSLAPSRPTS